ncbi:MAG TPA: tetratricopeptide repeat protein [Thermoanaerobaculia bacterium]|jgi:serine/threonine-protein kinase|nr:tetratricopeptide repeat protein [Thermoanaerobaculia bacterium]
MSDPARFQRLDALFDAVLERPPAERAAFLDTACAGDAGLRREVERLLAADARATSFLEQPAVSPSSHESPEPPLPRRLGPYLLLREIGGGGMGVVYLARRDDEQYEREVAVKILRAGSRDTEAVHRFLAERQILARLEHPDIARLYDGGTTEDGRPFLVMELVDGLPLDEYCDLQALPIDARLALFRRVCAAVQYAHQNLLVHRDLKPANILVTAGGEPKLLDFGIAKQLAPEGADTAGTDLTRTGSRMMTPSYASPEQIRGEPITTATDVYSLGVLLYGLLTGRGPYRVASGLPHEIEHAICDQEPERPSQALFRRGDPAPKTLETTAETVARARGTRPAALQRKLRGDLDTIVLTALRKEPARRYASAAELAADLDRHLQHLPVAARPDTLLYRTRKLLRRRQKTVAAAAIAAVVALGFVVGLVEQGRNLARERDKARYALSFLVDTFREASPYETERGSLTAGEILEEGSTRVSRELAKRPDAQAAVMDAIGEAQLGLGRADAAAPLLARALELRRKAGDTEPLELATSLEHLAGARYEQSAFPETEALLREAVALRRREDSDPEALAAALNQLGQTVAARDAVTKEVEALHQEALSLAHRAEGAAGPLVAESLILLGRRAGDQGDYERAERLYREGLAVQRKVLGATHPKTIRETAALTAILLDGGKPKEAESLLLENLALQRRVLGHNHPDLLYTLTNLGRARQNQGDNAGAEAAYRQALALPRTSSNDANVLQAGMLTNLATVLLAQNRIEEAMPLLTEALELRRRALGDRHPLVGQILLHLARVERLRKHFPEGRVLAQQALAIVEEAEGAAHPHVAFPLREIGNNFMDQGNAAAAEPYLRRTLDVRLHSLSAGHPDVAKAQVSLAGCLIELGRKAEAETLLRQARATLLAGADGKRVKEIDDLLASLGRDVPPAR